MVWLLGAGQWCKRLALVAFLLTLAGCVSTGGFQVLPTPYSASISEQSSELTIEQESMLTELCPFGAPSLGPYYRDEPVTRIVRGGYAMDHYDRFKTPIWVCEKVTNENVYGPLTGRDPDWKADPILCPQSNRRCERGSTDSDYTRSGYDRGHLAPNMNQRLDPVLKAETFYFSNSAPQVGRKFNQTVWKNLESHVAELVRELGELWTISGVLYYDPAEENSTSADGLVHVRTIGQGNVYVPTHFYKIVIWATESGVDGAAFVMENREYLQGESWSDSDHRKAIRWIEERLGVDFMPNLEPVEADRVELSVSEMTR